MTKSKRLNRDHAKKTQRPMVEDEVIANQLEALLTPAITNQENYYRQRGLRDRILNLPLMVAAVLTLLWRDVPGVTELTRLLAREGFLWCNPIQSNINPYKITMLLAGLIFCSTMAMFLLKLLAVLEMANAFGF
jgi:hypothetical protein